MLASANKYAHWFFPLVSAKDLKEPEQRSCNKKSEYTWKPKISEVYDNEFVNIHGSLKPYFLSILRTLKENSPLSTYGLERYQLALLEYIFNLDSSCGRKLSFEPQLGIVLFEISGTGRRPNPQGFDHIHYGIPFLRPSAYKARAGGVSPRCEIEQIREGGIGSSAHS